MMAQELIQYVEQNVNATYAMVKLFDESVMVKLTDDTVVAR